MKREPHGVVAPADLRRQLKAEICQYGERETTKRIGLSPVTIARFLAGMIVHSGTVAVVRAKLRPVVEAP